MTILLKLLDLLILILPKAFEAWVDAVKERRAEKQSKKEADEKARNKRDDDWRNGDAGGVFNSP